MWALPGGFIFEDESLDDSAKRTLFELTGLSDVFMEQVRTFGEIRRFPIRRVITVSYYALIKANAYSIKAGALATEVKWFPVKKLPRLPFDHELILRESIRALQQKLKHELIGLELLPDKFSLTDIQKLYEAILNTTIDKRNFRKKMLKMNFLIPLNEMQQGVAHRAAELYKLNLKKLSRHREKKFMFDVDTKRK